MEEAIVDVALDLNLHLSEGDTQEECQQCTRTDHRDQAQLLATVPQAEQIFPVPGEDGTQHASALPPGNDELSVLRPQERAARVEALRECVANGTYVVDSAELARCLLRNATRFVETC
jgi:hypothetical protein